MDLEKIQTLINKICDATVTDEDIESSGIEQVESDAAWKGLLGDPATAYERYFHIDTVKKMIARFHAGEISLHGFHLWAAYYEGAFDPSSEEHLAKAHEKDFYLQDLLKHVTANVFTELFYVPWERNDSDLDAKCDCLAVAHHLYQNLEGWKAICWMENPSDPVVWLLCYHEDKKKYCRLNCSFFDFNPEVDEDGDLLIAPYKVFVDKVENKEDLDTRASQLESEGYTLLTAKEIENI